jgi:hypothetical protein
VRENLLAAIAAIDARDLRRAGDGVLVWRLSDPGVFARDGSERRDALAAAKKRILHVILEEKPPVFINHPDDPGDVGLVDGWERVAGATYALRTGFDFASRAAEYWLFTLGNWCFYSAAAPVTEKWPDSFTDDPVALLTWMRSAGVHALVDSWPDDAEWVVAIGAAESMRNEHGSISR